MKFIFTADLHIKIYNDVEYTSNGIPLKLQEIYNAITQMCDYAVENNISTIIVGGDINDLKNVVHVRAFVLLRNIISKYNTLKFILLHGNHDISSKYHKESSIYLLNSENVVPIVETTIIDNITYIPFSNRLLEEIRESEPNDILISHFGLSDALLSNGTSLVTNIKKSDLDKFKLVLLGHYHKPQEYDHIIYVGSPIQLRRDEVGENKRFVVVDSEALTYDSIEIIGYRKFYEISINDDDDVNMKLSEAKSLVSDGNFVTIKNELENTPDDLLNIDNVRIINVNCEEHLSRGITTSMNITEQLKKYLEINSIPDTRWDEYLNIALKHLNKENDSIQENDVCEI